MDHVDKMLKSSEEAVKMALNDLEIQILNIESLPDSTEKAILKQAVGKAKEGDLEEVKRLIQKVRDARTS